MATKNYNEAVANKNKRQLTAKGYKFLWRCIDIVAASKGSNRYSPDMKPLNERLTKLIHYLLIDEELTIEEVANMIKDAKYHSVLNIDLN